jgi:hypothetical protein
VESSPLSSCIELREETDRRQFTNKPIQAAGGKKSRKKWRNMMRKKQAFLLLLMAIFLVLGSLAAQESSPQTGVRKMNITGEIAKAQHGYIIRGKVPAEIFTILNPAPDKLDAFVKSEKTISLEVRIVSGDNVEIEKIDGKDYRQ